MQQLGDDYKFPSPQSATKEGIVAVGGDLNPLRILEAYKNGIFPWFNDDENLMWWSPDPRMILFSIQGIRRQGLTKMDLDRVHDQLVRI